MHESRAVGDLSGNIRLGIVGPKLTARPRIECHDPVVGSTQIENSIHHQRCGLEHAGGCGVLGQRLLASLPLPGEAQPPYIGSIDVGKRRILGSSKVTGKNRPFAVLSRSSAAE